MVVLVGFEVMFIGIGIVVLLIGWWEQLLQVFQLFLFFDILIRQYFLIFVYLVVIGRLLGRRRYFFVECERMIVFIGIGFDGFIIKFVFLLVVQFGDDVEGIFFDLSVGIFFLLGKMIVFENFFRELFKSELLIFIIRGIFLMFMLKIMVMFLIDVLICYFLIFRLSRIGVVVFRFFMLICFWN